MLGSAATAALMQGRLEANLPGAAEAGGDFAAGQLPDMVVGGFSDAMAQTMLLPGIVLLVGVVAVLFMQRPAHLGER